MTTNDSMTGENAAPEIHMPDYANRRTPRPRTLLGHAFGTLLAGVLLGVVAGLVSYISIPTRYACTGIIDFRPVLPSIPIGSSTDPKPSPMYDSYVSMHMQIIKSERCLDNALSSPRWTGSAPLVRSNSPAAEDDFRKHLTLARDGELVRITFTAPDKKTAQDGVGAVLDAYNRLKDELDPESPRVERAFLEEIRREYSVQLVNFQSRMQNIADSMNAGAPEALRAKFAKRLNEADQAFGSWKLSQAAIENWKILQVGSSPSPATASSGGATTLAQLEAQEQLERTRVESLKTEIAAMAHQVRELDELQHQFDRVNAWKTKVEQALEEVRLRQQTVGRIVIVSNGDRPVERDRLFPTAIAAGSGFVGGILLFLLMGALAARSQHRNLRLTRLLRGPPASGTSHPPA